jgi:esterase/lipase superfamily enzyme
MNNLMRMSKSLLFSYQISPAGIITLWSALAFCSLIPVQEVHAQVSQNVAIAKLSTTRSVSYHLHPGDQVSIKAQSDDPRFRVDVYIYNSDKTLAGKDDEDLTSPIFTWQAGVEDDYYVLARNLSAASGSINVAVNKSRSLVSQAPPNYATMRIFYATDRNVTGHALPNEVFGPEPDSQGKLHMGDCIVSIPREHEMGELEGPSILRLELKADPAKHVVLQRVEFEDQSVFFRGVANRISNSQNKEAFVFIHGFDTTFTDAARRTAQIAYDLGFDGPAILYSWPSQGKVSPIAYNQDGRNADLTVPHLLAFLNLLVAQSGASTIHLIAHSMGNRPLANVLKQIATSQSGTRRAIFNQVVLFAPDIDAQLFKQMAQQLLPPARRITLYASSQDEALKVSGTFAGYARAGQGGDKILVIPGIETIDASASDTSALGFFHQYYGDNSTVLSDLFHVLHGDAAASRFGLQQETTDAGLYWKLKAAARH